MNFAGLADYWVWIKGVSLYYNNMYSLSLTEGSFHDIQSHSPSLDIIHRALTSFTGAVVTTLKGAVPLQCCYKGGICRDNFDIIAKIKTGSAVLLNERCAHNDEQTGNAVVKVTAFWRSTNLEGDRYSMLKQNFM